MQFDRKLNNDAMRCHKLYTTYRFWLDISNHTVSEDSLNHLVLNLYSEYESLQKDLLIRASETLINQE